MRYTKIAAPVAAVVMALGGASIAVADPGPNGHNDFGLCTAYFAGSEKGQEMKHKAPPFAGSRGGRRGGRPVGRGVLRRQDPRRQVAGSRREGVPLRRGSLSASMAPCVSWGESVAAAARARRRPPARRARSSEVGPPPTTATVATSCRHLPERAFPEPRSRPDRQTSTAGRSMSTAPSSASTSTRTPPRSGWFSFHADGTVVRVADTRSSMSRERPDHVADHAGPARDRPGRAGRAGRP